LDLEGEYRAAMAPAATDRLMADIDDVFLEDISDGAQ